MSRIDRQAFRAQSRQEAVGYHQQRQATRQANPHASFDQRTAFRQRGIDTADAWAGRKLQEAQGLYRPERVAQWEAAHGQAMQHLNRREAQRLAHPDASFEQRLQFRANGQATRQDWWAGQPLR